MIGDSAERRVEILSDAEELNATWSRFGPRREGADLHVHRLHNDLFYVLSGELTVRLGPEDAEVAVAAGQLAHVPPLVVHGFRNASDRDVSYLNFHAPGMLFADYLRSVRDKQSFSYDQYDPPPDGGRRPSDATVGRETTVAEGVTLLVDVDEIAIVETTLDGRGREDARHVHRRHVESLYVLDGEVSLAAGDRELRARAGTWLQIPAGVPHLLASGAGGARILEVHTPTCGFGAFLRARHAGDGDETTAAAEAGFDVAGA